LKEGAIHIPTYCGEIYGVRGVNHGVTVACCRAAAVYSNDIDNKLRTYVVEAK
jgi:hypothetical protein